MGDDNTAALASLLVQVHINHQRKDVSGGCSCGWSDWGGSFARHVTEACLRALDDGSFTLRRGPVLIGGEDRYTGWTVNGVRETWQARAERLEAENRTLRVWATICSDLDRCEHGRHESDDCSMCGGPSQGNPMVPKTGYQRVQINHPGVGEATELTVQARTVGFSLDGQPIVMPDRQHRHDPNAWRQPRATVERPTGGD